MKRNHSIAGLALAGAVLTAYFWPGAPAPRDSAAAPALPLLTIPAAVPRSADAGPAAPVPAGSLTERLINPLERAADLRAVYEQFKNSADASERHAAYRAWSACFPIFIGAEGQAVSLDSVTRAIPPDDPDSAARIGAYQALMGRCKGFSDLPRAQLLAETERQKSAAATGTALAPGELAARYLEDGAPGKALEAARAVLASRDPAAIDSLREFVANYLVLQVDAQTVAVALDLRPDLRALAYAIAACRMGLECGPGSLTALQQCANSGACSGDVSERYLQSIPEAADRARLLAESELVVQAIGAGDYQALGL
jgi:hypothetical protein